MIPHTHNSVGYRWVEEGMADLWYLCTYLTTLYTIPIYLQQDLPSSYIFTWVVGRPAIHIINACMYVTVYVGGCMRTYVCVICMCVYERSKVGTNECMLNTSCTHVNTKEVRYTLVVFSRRISIIFQ